MVVCATMALLMLAVLLALSSLVVADREAISTMTGAHKSGERLVGGNRCTWGPSYWCEGVKKAKQCGAVNHCVQAVWAKEDGSNGFQDGSAVCAWCDDLMDDIRELVAANTTKVAMRGCLKDGCRRLPDASRRSSCLEEMSEDLAEVRQMLASGVPDRTICRTINFCSIPAAAAAQASSMPMTPLIPAQMTPRNYCRDCHNFFEDAKEIYIGNYTEDEFKQMLLDQCDQAGYAALSELCKTVIDEYWPQIYARLKMFFDPDEVCIQLNFCEETAKIRRHWTLPMIPVAQARARTASKSAPVSKMLSGLPLDRMLLNLNVNSGAVNSRSPAKAKKVVSYKSDVECVVCEFVMAYLDKMLADNYTEAAIQSALGRVCSIMPKSVRDDCQSFVDQYAPAIFVILSNELDPAMVCQGLQLCNSASASKKLSCGTSGATCDSCTDVFQAIKTEMEDYDENVRISNMIKSYCAFFPSDARDQCETAVTTYVPYALQMMAQLLKPEAVCKAVKLC